jgi:hypothetical protein
MKALTLTQPYATLVAIGAKRIETRSWSTRYRGPLAIHAGKGLGPVGGERGLVALYHDDVFAQALKGYALPRGVIVATCILMDVVETVDIEPSAQPPFDNGLYVSNGYVWCLDDRERAFGDYSSGRYAWLLADVCPLDPPIPATGRQGLWEWTESEVAA